ncbi:MAG: FAD-dependent oxidoreductase, partial [Epsilonproteobacteria bacterium]|nr:FAD-dependent oxidoreductase [Campylobacterota bacterium]
MGKVAIIGGGIAATTTALLLDEEITLFEKNSSLISGPPFCHLHAGGNLYPDIPIKEAISLLKESIEFLRLYPFGVDYRPTIITFPKSYKVEPLEFQKRLEVVKKEYEKLV